MWRHESLKVYRRARQLVPKVYEICDALPDTERYNIGLQLRKAAVSVRSNIAEGAKRDSNRQFRQFLKYSDGSAIEARELLRDIIRLRMDFLRKAEAVQLEYGEVGLMLAALSRTLEG